MDRTLTFGSRSSTFNTSVTVERRTKCNGRDATTTTTRPRASASKPVVTVIRISLARPVSTYTVTTTTDGDGSIEPSYEYEWKMSGEECGTPRTPWTQTGKSVTWSHADDRPDSCSHATQDHAVVGSVTVRSGLGPETTCTFGGSESRVINNPVCN